MTDRKIDAYIIAADGKITELCVRVARWMDIGYVPIGGICSDEGVWAQAMVKYEEKPKVWNDDGTPNLDPAPKKD